MGMNGNGGSRDTDRNEKGDGEGAKYIRTLGSKSLSGLRRGSSVGCSGIPSTSLSPSQKFIEGCHNEDNNDKSRRSVSVAEEGDEVNTGINANGARDTANVYNTRSSSSVYSMTHSGANSIGTSTYRVAQACDRCRAKKTRCDGKRPQCSQCALVGFECKVSDKLSRRAFPRGYTETLEERVRELEAENRRLVALCDIKEQQIHLVSQYSTGKSEKTTKQAKESDERMLQELSSASGGTLQVSSTNLYLLNKTREGDQSQHLERALDGKQFDDNEEEKHSNSCVHPKVSSGGLIVNPVSVNLNDPTSVSFEQNEAPGLPAVKALTSMSTREQNTQLATLVALSVPRSTEEILFIPQLLARIRQIYGFTSKQCLYSVSLLSSLKANLPEPQLMKCDTLDYLKSKNLWEIDDLQDFFINTLKFNIKNEQIPEDIICLSSTEIDDLVQLFFKNCATHIPIVNKEEFFSYYDKFKHDIENQPTLFKNSGSNFGVRSKMISYKIFACILLIVCQMGLLVKVKNEAIPTSSNYTKLISYYQRAINLLYTNPYFSVLTTSLQSLQFLALSLFYFLNTGSVSAIYELRGRVVSMAQQLRLHRCPSAVLGGSGSTMNKREQGDRRVLFWGIYYLDVFSALQLGVPRLFKDFEIECALPVSEHDDKKVSLAGHMIRLEGCVSQFSLAVIRYAKVLGNILDSIFKRGLTESIVKDIALIHENALDNWRRGLSSELFFEIDVNGTINMDEFNRLKQENTAIKNMDVMTLVVLYFLAKAIIHLPVVAIRKLDTNETSSPGNDANRSGSTDLKSNEIQDDSGLKHRSSSSYILLQQATNTMLSVLEAVKSVYLPLPINVARTKTRFALLSARGLLEYTKGGALFLDNKNLLLDIVKDIEEDKKLEIPGIISWYSLKLLDMTVNLLLQTPNTKVEKLDKLLKKKLNYYNRLMGRPIVRSSSISQNNQKRKFTNDNNNTDGDSDIKTTNLTPASSKGEITPPPRKQIKVENDDDNIDTIDERISTIPEANKHDLPQNSYKNPVSTQNAIAEAFQLDPVLNSNLLSDVDLTAFFSGYNSKSDILRANNGSQGNNSHWQQQNNSKSSSTPQTITNEHPINKKLSSFAVDDGKKTSDTVLDGLFRVPSNADFLNDEYYYPGNSALNLSQYNYQGNAKPADLHAYKRKSALGASHAGPSFSNVNLNSLFGHMNNDNKRVDNTYSGTTQNDNTSGFNFAVDASFSLAPLLAWTPDMTAHTNSVANHNSNGSDRTGVILDSAVPGDDCSGKYDDAVMRFGNHPDSSQPVTCERSYTNVPLSENSLIPTLASNSNHRYNTVQNDSGNGNDESNAGEILTLCSRRRPRRRRPSYSQEGPRTKNASDLQPNVPSQSRKTYQDLFQWQNSK